MKSGWVQGAGTVSCALRRRAVDLHTTARVEMRLEAGVRVWRRTFYSLGTLLLLGAFIHRCWYFITSLMIKRGCCSLPQFARQHFYSNISRMQRLLRVFLDFLGWLNALEGAALTVIIMFGCPKIEKV